MALSTENLLEALMADPTNSYHRGRLQGYVRLTDDPTERRLIQGRLDGSVAVRRVFTPYSNPAIAAPALSGATKRNLTVGEVTWLATMDDDPSKISERDAQTLATMRDQVTQAAERSMVDRRLVPVREYHATRARVAQLERDIAFTAVAPNPMHAGPLGASAPDWADWRDLLVKRIRSDIPELHETEAAARAQRLVEERWQSAGQGAAQRREEMRAELGEILRTNGLVSEVFPDAVKWGATGDPGYHPPAPEGAPAE